jgi:peptide subunit release factor 1 (eRF1)
MRNKKHIFDCDSCDRKIRKTKVEYKNNSTCLICLDEKIEKECDKMRQVVLNAGQDPNELFKLPVCFV